MRWPAKKLVRSFLKVPSSRIRTVITSRKPVRESRTDLENCRRLGNPHK